MDFTLSEEQVMFRDLFRDFAAKEIAKVAEHTDKHEEPPRNVLRKAAAQGFLGGPIPEQYGGAAMDTLTYCLLLEEFARQCQSTAVTVALHTSLTAQTILDAGTEEQKQEYLSVMASGELGAFALTEPDAGSDTANLQTRAVFADGAWHLDGVKSWVSNGGLAHTFIVFAKTDKGLSAFLVDSKHPGVMVGHREPTLGLRGLDVRTVYFEGLRLPEDSLLGPLNGGAAIASRAYDRLKIALAAVALGAAENALQLGVSFAIERKQFGVAIAHKQAMQNYIADVHADIEALRYSLYQAAWLVDAGQDFSHAAGLVKYLGARVAKDAANKMLQVHGGYGFSDEYTISRVYRDVRALRILGGADELQRVQIASDVLKQAGVTIKL
jgi:alkylation response protein AidB-like acyl-CoA dehydrogenase